MANAADVAAALLARCETLSVGSPALPVVLPEPDATFTPPKSDEGDPLPYLRVDLFNNLPAWEGLSDGVVDQGLLQIVVVWPKNEGIAGAMSAVDGVKAHFPKGLRLNAGVKINLEPRHASPLSEADKLSVPVTIPFVA